MNLFTITAPIISLVAGIFVGPYIFHIFHPDPREPIECAEIRGLEQVQRWKFYDWDGARLPLCPDPSQQPGEADVNGGGT
jgi:hypothetical protein